MFELILFSKIFLQSIFLLFVGKYWINFFQFAIQPGNILGFIGSWDYVMMISLQRKYRQALKGGGLTRAFSMRKEHSKRVWLRKPSYGCKYCMSSIHGTIVFFLTFAFGLHELSLFIWPLYCISLCGFLLDSDGY